MKLPLVALLLLAASVHAAPYAVDLKYEKLTLRNGQDLRDVVIKSYDHATGKVVIQSARQISSVQVEMLPEEIGTRVFSLLPQEAKDAARREKAERAMRDAERSASTTAHEKRSVDISAKSEAQAKANEEEAKRTQQKADERGQAKSVARKRADRYFRYELKPGSGYVYVVGAGVQIEEPVEVAGWDRRYRVSGSVGLEYYDSYGRIFDTVTRNFEILTGPDSNGNIVALDLSVK